jgi:hypothetical protein
MDFKGSQISVVNLNLSMKQGKEYIFHQTGFQKNNLSGRLN